MIPRNRLLPVVALLVAMSAPAAHAETLTISGRVTTAACSLQIPQVLMGKVPVDEFRTSATPPSAYHKQVTIALTGCDIRTLNSAALTFNGTSAPGQSTILALSPLPNQATGFGVRLDTDDATHAAVTRQVRFDGAENYRFDVNSGQASFTFKAYYTRLPGAATVKAGVANATATVTLSYS